MASRINHAIFKLIKRAEKQDKEHLINTFVDVGPLLTLLRNPDHQILYGRRGTGKTHAFSFLYEEMVKAKNIAIYIDMRQVGSNGGIYTDLSLSITERATRLLNDTYSLIHDQILEFVLANDEMCDLSLYGPILDELKSAINEIEVVGNVSQESNTQVSGQVENGTDLKLSLSNAEFGINAKHIESESLNQSQKVEGFVRHRVHFTTVNSIFSRIKKLLVDNEIWILFDEWAEIPNDLQPYLADLLRRTLFPIRGISVKIAAIEKRTNFKTELPNGYVGLETGADVSASINLDEFMVFDNDSDKAKLFFGTLLYNHVNQFLLEEGEGVSNIRAFIKAAFTQDGAFEELVRASEGIPRDAINILVHAAIKANDDKISIPIIRSAARTWYSSDKEKSVNSNKPAKLLLRWIIDEVIGQRNSRAFLLSSDIQDPIVEYLFDNRVIHIIKQNISSKDVPGERYNVFTIDYGAYVHLINTSDEPKGLFVAAENDSSDEVYVEVPINDYRSIRRSILDLNQFYQNTDTLEQ